MAFRQKFGAYCENYYLRTLIKRSMKESYRNIEAIKVDLKTMEQYYMDDTAKELANNVRYVCNENLHRLEQLKDAWRTNDVDRMIALNNTLNVLKDKLVDVVAEYAQYMTVIVAKL